VLASIGLGSLEAWLEDLPTAALVGIAAGAVIALCGAALATARVCSCNGRGERGGKNLGLSEDMEDYFVA
jgi:hypothetical protein